RISLFRRFCKYSPFISWIGCGGGFEKSFIGRKSEVRTLNSMKQESIMNAGADMVVVDCPGCLMAFDRNSMEIKKAIPELNISYMHVAEFLALALGAHPYETVGIQFHTAYRPILNMFSIQPPKNVRKSVHLLKYYSFRSDVRYRK
ncbi:heterodisulfide reductase-related iron-sulfur binding cluster, partial [Chloroflexota bacterium]